MAEAKMYTEQKRRKEMEASAQRAKEPGNLINNNKITQKISRPMSRDKLDSDGSPLGIVDNYKIKGLALDSSGKDSPLTSGQANLRPFDDWDVTGLPGADLLSESVSWISELILLCFFFNQCSYIFLIFLITLCYKFMTIVVILRKYVACYPR